RRIAAPGRARRLLARGRVGRAPADLRQPRPTRRHRPRRHRGRRARRQHRPLQPVARRTRRRRARRAAPRLDRHRPAAGRRRRPGGVVLAHPRRLTEPVPTGVGDDDVSRALISLLATIALLGGGLALAAIGLYALVAKPAEPPAPAPLGPPPTFEPD